VLKLFLPNGAHRFAGRVAHGLAYQSERLSRLQRWHYHQSRPYAKLGVRYRYVGQPPPEKPKWMRWPTYDRLVADIERGRDCAWPDAL
jgi:hypothetical protein